MGIVDLNQKYNIDDMVKGDVIFCATGVTDGDLVKGIKDHGDSFEAETYVLHKTSNTNKIIKNNIKK
jgi:fructose-1,6-bisphosphatase II / sedoheptulose-1,7-bisphosphatase